MSRSQPRYLDRFIHRRRGYGRRCSRRIRKKFLRRRRCSNPYPRYRSPKWIRPVLLPFAHPQFRLPGVRLLVETFSVPVEFEHPSRRRWFPDHTLSLSKPVELALSVSSIARWQLDRAPKIHLDRTPFRMRRAPARHHTEVPKTLTFFLPCATPFVSGHTLANGTGANVMPVKVS
jgi:hypothetical protein